MRLPIALCAALSFTLPFTANAALTAAAAKPTSVSTPATPSSAAHARPVLTEARKIELLISHVAQLPGATFIRNGKAHDSKEAADHLRMKWKYAGRRISTAADFIRLCATESSVTHVDYHIRLADGRDYESGKYLLEQLRLIERGDAAVHASR